MPPLLTPLYRLLTPLLQRPSLPKTTQTTNTLIPKNAFSTTTPFSARQTGSKALKQKQDMRITLIRYHLLHPKTPRPLRLSRLRALRHWTIHRAWQLFRRKDAERRERSLERQYQSMAAACEELRLLDGPGVVGGGRLYRIAMEKKGIFRKGGVPIEYARAQVERPGKEAWNHGWTR